MTNANRFKEAEGWAKSVIALNDGRKWIQFELFQDILEALQLAQSGVVLPVLPSGWRYRHVETNKLGKWFVEITDDRESDYDCFGLDGKGSTPHEAATNAIAQIEGK